jgi:penicillin-binding protein 2
MFKFHFSEELKRKKVKLNFKEDIEPQEILLDSLAKKKEREFGISEKKLEVPLSRKILQGFFIFSLILIFVLFGKTFQLQIIEGKKYSTLAENNKFKILQIQAERGVIYDKNLKQLVENLPSFDLFCQKNNLPQQDSEKNKIFRELSVVLNKSPEEIEKMISESENPTVLVAENIPQQTLILLETRIEEFPGFQIRRNLIRNYTDGNYFAHLIGYTGKITAEELKSSDEYSIFDWVGREGVEKSYESVLREKSGKLQIEKDASGNIISQKTISLPESGKSLVLWLDSDLQKKIYDELKAALERVGAKAGAAIALDPKTGGVLSLVSVPSFDNNLFQKGASPEDLSALFNDPNSSLFNRVISGEYFVGSTIKPFTAYGALEENLISPDKEVDCRGQITIPSQYDPSVVYIYEDHAVHGWTSLRKAIAESCNVYFYTIGGGYGNQEGLGPTRIKKYLELFGWGKDTGIDIPGESEGFVPTPAWKKEKIGESWWDGDTYHLSIGQGYLLVTPLQVAEAYSTIANGGTLFQPQVVKEIVDSQKNMIEEIKPKIIRENFIDLANLQPIKEGMRETSIYGTAAILNNLPVKTASKSGTAQTNKAGYYHNWISVYAPYDDPQIVLTIVITDVKGALAAATPVARNVLEWYFGGRPNYEPEQQPPTEQQSPTE